MDGFRDRLSQHFSSSKDMIAANGQAEATQVENLQAEVHALMETLESKLGQLQVAANSGSGVSEEQLTGVGDKLESHIHKENVRVYRNVQASVTDELGKQTTLLTEEMGTNNEKIIEELTKQTEMLADMMATLNDQQKSQGEAISNMAVKMNHMEEDVRHSVRSRALLPIQIIMFILLLGDLAINVLLTLGYLG